MTTYVISHGHWSNLITDTIIANDLTAAKRIAMDLTREGYTPIKIWDSAVCNCLATRRENNGNWGEWENA